MLHNLEASHWETLEFKGISLGDERLNNRSIKLLHALSENPQSSIPSAAGSWKDTIAAYRFFDNPKVSHDQLLKSHIENTLKRAESFTKVLAIQDTTSLNYSTLEYTEGLGDIGGTESQNNQGLMVHNTYLVSAEGVPLGLVAQKVWSREESKCKTSQERISTPIKYKESYKWIESLHQVAEQTSECKFELIHVMDREADIYEVFSEAKDLNNQFIIRSRHNRRINKSSRGSNDGDMMLEKLSNQEPLATVKIEVPSRGSVDRMRLATVELRALKFNVTAPRVKSMDQHDFQNEVLELTVISAKEIVRGKVDRPIDWYLVTNFEVKTRTSVLECLEYYCLRWQVEVFHRILKTGCQIESCQFEEARKIESFLALQSIVAWRMHWISLVSRHRPKTPATFVFSTQEQEILCLYFKKSRRQDLSLMTLTILLGRLGGFLARKNDGFPGPEVLWRGWLKLKNMEHVLKLTSRANKKTCV